MGRAVLEALGVIPTVYSLVYPETRETFDEVRVRPDLPEMYERAWTRHQDPMHEALFERWQAWAEPVLDVEWERFPHRYVSAGSSEAIRDSVAAHVADAHRDDRAPRLHIFEGEYEGFPAYGEAYHCEVVRHDRRSYAESLAARARPGDRFYLSAPSSIDGMVWPGYPDFVQHLATHHPRVKLAVDLCYVGCVGAGDYRIGLDAPNIDSVFFSLSKVFGVYYHRIGGVFATGPRPGLHGNVWFKNLLSIRLGVALLERYPVFELPRRYRAAQERVVETMRPIVGAAVRPADVVLLARHPGPAANAELAEDFERGVEGLRFCLTPALDRAIKGGG